MTPVHNILLIMNRPEYALGWLSTPLRYALYESLGPIIVLTEEEI
jgi:hypothetical protein